MGNKRQRYILEGTWGNQHRVYHRTVIYDPDKYKNLKSILFDDGTSMRLSIRKAIPYEKIVIIHGYDSLIDKCLRNKVSSVTALTAV
ncbi:MAG: hypothetical protein PHS93_08755 [Candidatus Omnitrophica bacterium]|nr:hypothetical protein [Candidatus Omnitrophota bacterium]